MIRNKHGFKEEHAGQKWLLKEKDIMQKNKIGLAQNPNAINKRWDLGEEAGRREVLSHA